MRLSTNLKGIKQKETIRNEILYYGRFDIIDFSIKLIASSSVLHRVHSRFGQNLKVAEGVVGCGASRRVWGMPLEMF